MKNTYDIAIIGAGPMGIATAIEAQANGLSHIVLEKGSLVNSVYHFPKSMTFFSTSEKLEIGGVPFVSINEKPKRDEALEYYRRVAQKWELNIHTMEEVVEVKKEENTFRVVSEKDAYFAKNVVVATGFYDEPNLLNVPGESLPKVSHYFDDAHPYIGKKVAVIGAANSATQVALELFYKGAEVSLIVRDAEIGQNVKYWIRPNIVNRIKSGEITGFYNTSVQEITPNSIILKTPEGVQEIENDFVFAMIGYHPNYQFLEKIGINCETDPFRTPDFKEDSHMTNIEGLYVAGVVCGGGNTSRFFIENSKEHAQAIIQNILK
ncbi:YpdA family putative bacillithiol disulfide reductase [Ornithobacterium rhinotracheale]|uniref:Putative bacillithiol system thiol disulfide oxidoreductase, YpdA family n=1 Tax=Ornithobacterium rhinotracheale (strain ATCC 51463 / DSM 15997 / CCUG 23171 / CIP 104009 / LMG 9086) TaxID=867902 RepID=I3ZXG0_ORNRL|nr:YpdA family putative bacillithiol disulfide reductase [Ornithobacterium rhinotracheale]AFL96394.1 putative bacillithiol system thiol disulfide oxidoreductase, YpdA family [Ornithobacterium rhinotracheale DSM 15997]AIP98618.1 FAD-dependent pyridine nucleotide-disulfide oxidoreductase [Ornithobacterium rhinotracheale ORT-UMN 88]KGB67621.1 FAD-dependent pyridine nucleotide-disulfide oxidoreductase [Ornithobacterium rhinotracheale H06-030791]MCK0194723.1 YpdA family putative bacillithiol disulfi